MVGGVGTDSLPVNDVCWLLDLNSGSWLSVNDHQSPSARSGCAAVAIDGGAIIAGGLGSKGEPVEDVCWILDLKTLTWCLVEQGPSVRHSCGLTALGIGSVMVCGGLGLADQPVGDACWLLDLGTFSWQYLAGGPLGGDCAAAVAIKHSVIVVGTWSAHPLYEANESTEEHADDTGCFWRIQDQRTGI